MTSPVPSGTLRGQARVVVVGNPNAGKTTLFNRLTGLSQKVGNYPGVTVEKKVGTRRIGNVDVELVDLPGTYSLAAHSPDEMVAVDVILGHEMGEPRPDLVLQVVDASNLERNLYLLSQVLELGVPVVVALNMVDLARARGIAIDAEKLSARLGVTVVAVESHRGTNFAALEQALERALDNRGSEPAGTAAVAHRRRLDDRLHEGVEKLHQDLAPSFALSRGRDLHPFEVLRAVIDRGGHAESRLVEALGNSCRTEIDAVRRSVAGAIELPLLEARVRYGWVRERLAGCVSRNATVNSRITWSERLDRVLTHRVFGLLLFALLMLVIFEAIFSGAEPLMGFIEGVFGQLAIGISALLPAGAMQSLAVDGILAGVSMVVVFLPQILILFLFIGLLEDCGYMARAAFIMDRLMQKCGLSGKSFIPMLSGFACAVPGIMATRVIEDRRDRLATILVTPLMSCSARLPVYSLFIGAFIPAGEPILGFFSTRGLTLFALYVLGIITAVAVAWILRRTLLRGDKAPFVLELPSYKWPSLGGVVYRLYERGMAFLKRAGTLILAIAIVVWALAYFPHRAEVGAPFEQERERLLRDAPEASEHEARLATIAQAEAGAYLRDSYFGRMGHAVEPVFRPLGWDWRLAMAAIASFPAREVILTTLGILFNLGGAVDEESEALRDSLRQASWPVDGSTRSGAPLVTVPVALSVLVFFALCCQCGATVVTIRRETNSWSWAIFAFSYMTVLAYIGALVVYQVGVRI